MNIMRRSWPGGVLLPFIAFFTLTLLFTLFFALSAPPAAAEDACAIPVSQPSGDHICLLDSSYTETSPLFSDFCIEQGGTVVDSSDVKCNQVCCCDQSVSPKEAIWPEPVSEAFCSQQPNYAVKAAQSDCVSVCGGGAGGGGTTGAGGTFTVSGIVYDDQNPTTPERLADARIQFPAGSTLVTVFSDDQGAFTLYNVPQGTVNFKASKYGCGQQEQSRDISGDVSNLDFHLDCSVGECQIDHVNDTTAVPVPGSDKVTVSWTVSSCPNIQSYEVKRCTGEPDSGGTNCEPVGFTSDGQFIDNGVPADQKLCYTVAAIKPDGGKVEQSEDVTTNCVAPMSQYCLDGGSARATCFNGDTTLSILDSDGQSITPFTGSARCTEQNQLELVQECGSQQKVCYYTSQGTTGCRLPDDCDKCNGLYGWLVDAAAAVTGGDSCADLSGCVLDNHGYAEDTFSSCDGVTSCYDYRSEEACSSGSTVDKCHVSTQGCRWVSPPGLAGLGKGVCVPKDAAAKAECEECSNVFGFCNATLCGEMGGTCYWNTKVQQENVEPAIPEGAPGECLSRENMACAYYDSEDDCKGGSNVVVDVTYNDSIIDAHRIDGTNELTPSRDVLGFGTCAWVDDASATGGYCVKDANGLRVANPLLDNKVVDDCLEHPLEAGESLSDCFRDNEPPTTTLPFSEGSYIDAQLLRSVPPVVQDNAYEIDPREATRFCLAPRGQTCYPNATFDSLLPETIGAAPYTLYYYSFDPAGNLEPVKHTNLNIDRDNNIFLVSARLITS